MFQSVANVLNKSFGSNKSSSPEKLADKLSPNNQSPNPEKPQGKQLPPKTCKLCKGAGCCNLCDKDDDWEGMIGCSNKTIREHWIHYSCDNLTPEIRRAIYKFYCPTCRLDNFQITFKRDTSSAKREEIKKLLYTPQSSKPVDMAYEAINLNSETLNPSLETKSDSGALNPNLETQTEVESSKSDFENSKVNLENQMIAQSNNSENFGNSVVNSEKNKSMNNQIPVNLTNNIGKTQDLEDLTKNIETSQDNPYKEPEKSENIKTKTDEILAMQDETTNNIALKTQQNENDDSDDSLNIMSSKASFSSESDICDSFYEHFPGQQKSDVNESNRTFNISSPIDSREKTGLYVTTPGYHAVRDKNFPTPLISSQLTKGYRGADIYPNPIGNLSLSAPLGGVILFKVRISNFDIQF